MNTMLDETRLDLAKLFTGVGVEIGVAEGWYSSKIMELGNVSKMFGVDPYRRHTGYIDYTKDSTFLRLKTNAHARLDKYPNYRFIEKSSIDAVFWVKDEYLDFVYIDGDHSYEACLKDIKAWWPKLKPGGIMAGDDYMKSDRDLKYYDVRRAVNEWVAKYDLDLTLYAGGGTPTNWLVRKP